jgi:hypothetical protein
LQFEVRLLSADEVASAPSHPSQRMSAAQKTRIRRKRAILLRRHGVTPRVG